MQKTFIPQGVCSRQFDITMEDGVIQNITITGGCNGNLKGISALLRGQKAEDVIARLKGTQCGMRATSCPDQIAIALQECLDEEAGA